MILKPNSFPSAQFMEDKLSKSTIGETVQKKHCKLTSRPIKKIKSRLKVTFKKRLTLGAVIHIGNCTVSSTALFKFVQSKVYFI